MENFMLGELISILKRFRYLVRQKQKKRRKRRRKQSQSRLLGVKRRERTVQD